MLTKIKSNTDLLDRWAMRPRVINGTITLTDTLVAHMDIDPYRQLRLSSGGKDISRRYLAELRIDRMGRLVYPVCDEGRLERIMAPGIVFPPSIDEQERVETAADYISVLIDDGISIKRLSVAAGVPRGLIRNLYLGRARSVAWDVLAQLYSAGTMLDLIAGRVPR